MARIIYSSTKSGFLQDWADRIIVDKMLEGAGFNHIAVGPAEKNSWRANSDSIAALFYRANKVPDDAMISFEYKVPKSGGRIDCMMYGKGADGMYHVVHIELKQWSNDSVHELYDNGVFEVEAFTGGGYRPVPHPIKQVAGYHRHLLNNLEVLSERDCSLDGMAYCYNYSSKGTPNSLFAPQYAALTDTFKLYSKDEIAALAVRLNEILCMGDGLTIFNRFVNSPNMPTKMLLDSAADIFTGVTEIALQEDQITASDEIFAEVKRCIRDGGKTAIVIKGGPGTGKTLIALHVLAALAKEGIYRHSYFTTRSKALRENLKLKLKNVSVGKEEEAMNAGDLITDIFDYKPYNFKESEIDVLLIDEAHRIGRSANFQTDAKYEGTFLSQTMALLYCSKVCVFFIDDHQAVKSYEIGTSDNIMAIARDYHNQFSNDAALFMSKQNRLRGRLESKLSKRDALLQDHSNLDERAFSKALEKLDEDITELQSQVAKDKFIGDATHHFKGEVKILELELRTQFRCNGSDNFLDWVDDVLFHPADRVVHSFSPEEYEFKFFETPQALMDAIRKKYDAGETARVAAGYCWRWSTELEPNGDLKKDVVIGDFKMPWETNTVRARAPFRSLYASSADTWATEPEGINQIGCIFSIQGMELDYIGVIIGPDLDYDPENDTLVAVPGKNIDVRIGNAEVYERHIKNIYRVLLTRGTKGCFVYSCNPGVSAFLQRCREPRI